MRGPALRIGQSTARILFVATCIAAVQPAMAKVGMDFTGNATVGVEHDTNPFQLSGDEPLAAGIDGSSRDDLASRATANATAALIAGPVELQLLGTFSHVEYRRFDDLNRNDFNLSGNLVWNSAKGGAYDFSLQYTQNRQPVGLADAGGNAAVQQTTHSAQGKLRIRPTSRWEIGLAPNWNESKTPLQDQPDFGYRVIGGRLSLDYHGAGRIIPGVAYTESHGRYQGAASTSNIRYVEQTFEGTLSYRTKGRSSVTVAAGYTARDTSLLEPTVDPTALAIEGKTPAFTGSLNLNYQLSVKTNLYVSAFRSFQQYQAGANTTIGTGFVGGASWAATSKFSVVVDGGFAWSNIEGVPLGGLVAQREDLVRSFSVALNYTASRRVTLRTHVTRQLRNSTSRLDQFNSTVAGLDLSARLD